MTQYLLGDLSEEETLRLEEQFFTDDEAFTQLQALEDELRYDYARGGLSREQRRQFEHRFLSQPGESQRVALAQAVLETVANANLPQASERIVATAEKPGFFQSLATFFGWQSSGLPVGLAAASVLLLLGGAWLFYQTVKLRGQVEQLEVARAGQEQQRIQLEQQANEQRSRGEQLNAQLEAERRQRAELEQELARQKAEAARANEPSPSAPATLLSFLLTPGLSRDIDSTKRLTIPANVAQIRLQLKLKRPGAYRSYQAVLQTLDGATLWQRNLSTPTVTLPTKFVPPGDYVLVLKGKTADGQWEEVDEYHFNTAR
ncbi:MAG TPA: hypothetical protein VFZ34_31850 [Blastocatellia bacterium]|nr:hypothetical protein [Blastocatellia bacterium]